MVDMDKAVANFTIKGEKLYFASITSTAIVRNASIPSFSIPLDFVSESGIYGSFNKV